MNKKPLVVLLILIALLGGALRFYKNDQNPPSLNGDEISFGYAAYSILQTGRDEHGKFMPLTFESVGDFKNPLPVYLMTGPVKVFGLTDFAVRLPNAIFGTLMIPAFFFFLRFLFKDLKVAVLGAFFMAVSAWNIQYSRFAYEGLIASFFVMVGIWAFMKMLQGSIKWGLVSAFFLVLAMYTSFAPRLFVPVFIFVVLIFNLKKLILQPKTLALFILSCGVLVLPLLYVSLFQGAGTRLTMVLISNDIEFSRYILLHPFQSIGDLPTLIFFWVRRFLNYLQPEFIFFNGLNMTLPGSLGLGLLYLFEVPFLILGVAEFIRRKIPFKAILVIWLLTGIFPDSLTNNMPHSGRLLQIAPVILILTTLGALRFYEWIKNLPKTYLRIGTSSAFAGFVMLILIHAYLVFVVHYPRDKGESFDEGLKQVALFINQHQGEYEDIIIDPRRGIDGPFFIANPYLYILFYSKYDPYTYQTEPQIHGTPEHPFYKFNKYTIRYINWSEDRNLKNTLIVGNQWDITENELRPGELLKKIVMTNGSIAFYIVSPR